MRHPARRRPLRRTAALAVLAVAVTACAGTPSTPGRRKAPDIAGFLRQPMATPTSCPAGVRGSASGRHSPWVGHVDVSVFLATTRPAAVKALGDRLRGTDNIARVYYESADDAYAEYQRLYTCSAAVPRSAVPASYRLVLRPVTHPERDALVRQIVRMPGVRDVACDPSDPCVSAASS